MDSEGIVLVVCLLLAYIVNLSAGVEGKFRHGVGYKFRRSSPNIRYEIADNRRSGEGQSSDTRRMLPGGIPIPIHFLLNHNFERGLLEYIKFIQNKENCTRTSLAHFSYKFPQTSYDRFSKQMEKAVDTASLLSGLFQATKSTKQRREDKNKKGKNDIKFIDGFHYLLVRSIVENDDLIFGCAIAFNENLYKSRSSFCPYAYKDTKTGKTIVKDLSRDLLYIHNLTTGCEWYRNQKYRNYSYLFRQNKTLYPTYEDTVGTVLDNVTVVSATRKEGLWSPPYFDCSKGENWLVTYSVPFFGSDDKFAGVVAIDIDLKNLDINQCSDEGLFAATHRCSMETTECKHVPGNGFHRGSYRCYCKQGFYSPEDGGDYFNGSVLEDEYINHLKQKGSEETYRTSRQCLPCAPGCISCKNSTPCFVVYDVMLRGIPLGIQSFCMTITLVLGFILIRLRRNRVSEVKKIQKQKQFCLIITPSGSFLQPSD